MEGKKNKQASISCQSCATDTTGPKKWYQKICIGQVGMFGVLVYILVMQLM